MSTIRLAQLIYTRVEPAYSPNRKTGFQTVYKSESLSPTDVNLIEKWVQCFRPDPPDAVRLQYFNLDDGSAILTHTNQIKPNLDIVDKAGRGAFLVHCLIISPADFDQIDHNPFVVFNHFNFLTGVEDMVTAFGRATGVAPITEFKAVRAHQTPFSNWTVGEARKLVRLAIQREHLRNQRQSVLFKGSEEEAHEALQTTFLLTPKYRRLTSTFDTHLGSCPIQPGLYWAVSGPTEQRGDNYILVDATKRRVIDRFTGPSDTEDLYLKWLEQANPQSGLSNIVERVSTVQALAKAFQRHEAIPSNILNQRETCQEFMDLHQNYIVQNLTKFLSDFVGKDLAASVGQYLLANVEPPTLLNMVASQNLHLANLSQLVIDWLRREKANLQDGDWRQLQNFARQSQNMHLLYLSAMLGKKIDIKVRDEALRSMDQQTYQAALNQLMSPIDPVHFVIPIHLPLLLSNNKLSSMTDEQYLDLVEAIIKAGEADQLAPLAKKIPFLSKKSLSMLEKMVKKQDKVPGRFKRAVYERQAILSPPRRLVTSTNKTSPSKEIHKRFRGVNIMPWFSRNRRGILCPYCLTEIRGAKNIKKCPNSKCNSDLPVQYVHDYDNIPPFFAQVFGWSQVGKTVFLSALTLMLVKMGKVWPRYAPTAATELSQQKVREINEYLSKGKMPPPTDLGPQNVYIMLLHNMERWGSRALVTRDCAGEIFDSMEIPVEQAPYLLNAPTTFMLISLPDLQDSGGLSMEMLLNNYINTLMLNEDDFNRERRKLVVVFTKADLIKKLPQNLRIYLTNDPIWAAVSSRGHAEQLDVYRMQEYVERMERVSDAIRDWISEDASGKTFVQLAENKNIETRYSLISSTGSDVGQDGSMLENLAPRRVLDPYFWALELQSQT